MDTRTLYLNDATHEEIRAPKDGRTYLEIVNADAAVIYYAEDTMASAENGRQVAANTAKVIGSGEPAPSGVPQGTIWLLGSAASPARQRVIVKQA